jgi:cupin fold WbuC family metalloprotein
MHIINNNLLNDVSAQAKENPRLRMNFNLHDTLDAKAQKLLNALEPGTELPVHRHTETAETYILLRGKIRVLFYDGNKELTETFDLNPLAGEYGIHIPKGQWHTLEVIESGTVIFEVKDGPYRPLSENDILR